MRIILTLFISLLLSQGALANTGGIKGKVVDSKTKEALSGISIRLVSGGATTTNNQGCFEFSNAFSGSTNLIITGENFISKTIEVAVLENQTTDLGEILMERIAQQDAVAFILDENAIEDDESKTQNVSSLLASSDDVYFNNYGFLFGSMRFNLRGYEQDNFTTYINGVNLNNSERGSFQFSSIGGLNDVFRNRESGNGLEMTSYSYGNVGGSTNIDLRPSKQAKGFKTSLALTNRAYTTRAMATYSSGILKNGWAFTISGSNRWSNEGSIEGTYYNSWSYFASIEKIFNNKHSISLATYGSPTERGTSSGAVQEAYDLVGDNLYNPNWGYQNGEKRNARIVNSFEPTAILSYEWKINPNNTFNAGLAGRVSQYQKSGLNWYNAQDPRPDYYRNLPSYQTEQSAKDYIANLWRTDKSASQLNWDNLYAINSYMGGDRATYIVENQHNNFKDLTFNATINSKINEKVAVNAGVEARKYIGSHYKTVNDLLGANYWLDIDQFSERDFPENQDMLQNDLNNPNRKVTEGDRFGYDYDLHSTAGNAWIQGIFKLNKLELTTGLKYTYNSFYREGNMKNGRAPENSYGKGKTHTFNDISGKVNAIYKLSGRHIFMANALYETRSPLLYNSYVSSRIKDTEIPHMKNGSILSGDVGYSYNSSLVKGRISGYYTKFNDQVEINNFYHDGLQTFINYVMTGVNKENAGIEVGLSTKITSQISAKFIGNFGQYRYANNPNGTSSTENGSQADKETTVNFDGFKLSDSPQIATSLGLDYMHPKMWFFNTNVNYYANNYVSVSPARREESLSVPSNQKETVVAQEKLGQDFIWDASVGKLIYFKNNTSLNINLSVQNLLNNKNIKTGGYEQGRFDVDTYDVEKFPNRYFYLQGVNFFLNIGYRF